MLAIIIIIVSWDFAALDGKSVAQRLGWSNA